jgi:hypothetical protein
MTDAGFGPDGETTLGVSYESKFWGASLSLAFSNEGLRFLDTQISDALPEPVLSLDELYGWVKPFGPVVKFTGGIFQNMDGIAEYNDDIDEYDMGIFLPGEDGELFVEPGVGETLLYSIPALANGFLTDLVLGPVTLQFLLASNYSGESASTLSSDLVKAFGGTSPVETDERFFRLGGRVIIDAGVGTFAAMFRTVQWPMDTMSAIAALYGMPPFPGNKANYVNFGGYFDFTAVKNLGVSVGYTGLLPHNDDGDVDNVLCNGVDLRATWTGIEGLSLSTHNNVSFAQGKEKDWQGMLGKDASYLTLFNAIGATKELTEKFSINALLSNLYSKTASDADTEASRNTSGVSAKFIVKVAENAEFNIGAALDVTTSSATGTDDETVTTFSIPVGIIVSF